MKPPRISTIAPVFLAAGCLGLLAAFPAAGGDALFGGNVADAVLGTDAPMRGRDLDDVDLSFAIDNDIVNAVLAQPPFEAELACAFFAQNGGEARRGVKVRFDGTVVTQDGTQPIPPINRRTKRGGGAFARWDLFPDGLATGEISVNVTMDPGGSKRADVWGGSCRVGAWKPCRADGTTLCLEGNRFRVEADWRDFDGSSGPGTAVELSDSQGAFYFFDPNNRQLVVDLLDRCNNSGFFWVFAAAQTDVEYTLTVTDTHTGETRLYDNPLGQPAPAIVDTQAFATCP